MALYICMLFLLINRAIATEFIHTVAGVSYHVTLGSDIEGTCIMRKYDNLTQNAEDWIANATYYPTYSKIGWDYFQVVTNGEVDPETQAYGAGYCEGALTCDSIINHWTNVGKQFCDNQTEFCDKVNQYLDGNNKWINEMVESNTQPFWYQVKLLYRQIDGIYYGHKKCGLKSLSKKEILWMNMLAEIEEMKDAFNMSQMSMKVRGASRCSAIVKLLPDFSDLWVAHDTWAGYESMLRQMKKYSMNYTLTLDSNTTVPGSSMTFSGYPGQIASVDDFYIVNTGLVVLETTIGNDNKNLWVDAENPIGKVSTLIRSIVANRLATGGDEWANIYKDYNNGLYNNQWMVVDMKQFTPGSAPKNGTLWILEQIPNFILAEEKTDFLTEHTYWPSYNIPSSPVVFNMSGNQEMVNKFGDWFSYENSPRARIFKRDHSNITDKMSLIALMRSNDYKNDPFSVCNCTPPYSAENAIAARCDLNPDNGTYPFPALSHRSHGAIDVKVTNYNLAKDLQFSAICGPTNGNSLPEFSWSKSDFKDSVSHVGQPDVFKFPLATTMWLFH